MSEKTSQKILAVIERNQVKMKPAGYFLACSGFWLVLAAIFFFLSVFWAGVFFHQMSALKGLYFLDKNLSLFFLSFPYLPMALLFLFIFLAIVAYRRGRMVCHHENWLLFFLLSLAGLLSGAVWLEWSRQSDNAGLFFRQGKMIDRVIFSPDRFWLMPERGTLKGTFVSFDRETGRMMVVLDGGESWVVETKNCSCHNRIPDRAGELLRVFGLPEKTKERIFHARQIWVEE